jgi:Meiotically up-regulated gene 113
MSRVLERKRCKMDGAVSRLAEEPRTIRDMDDRRSMRSPAPRDRKQITDYDAITIKEAVEWIFEGAITVKYLKGEVGLSLGGWRMPDGTALTTVRDARIFRSSMRFISPAPIEIEGIYVIGYHRVVKIGMSNNVKQRISSIQTSIPHKLTTYGVLAGQLTQEQAIHRRFKKHRLNGEWFRKAGDLAAWIESGFK